MPIDYDSLLATSVTDEPCRYTDRKSILYALATGFGADPLDARALAYVFEQPSLKTVPTMASMVLPSTFLANCGWDYSRVLHGGQRLELYRPLPPAADLLANRRVASLSDLGAAHGVRIDVEAEVRLANDDTVLFTLVTTLIARGDGGFGGPRVPGPPPHRPPRGEPDLVCDLPTGPDQALLFRLLGDRNPLHADPALARRVGFERPILHGRCTYGIACHAILKTICGYDFTLISGIDVRFSAPVFPGDVITTEMWQDGNIVSFRCLVKARDAVVIRNGKCTLASN